MISGYTGLLAAVASWLNRTDLTDQMETFLTLAETRINRDLRVSGMETPVRTQTVAGDPALTLPEDFLQAVSVELLATPRRSLEFLTTTKIAQWYPTPTTGVPTHFGRLGNYLQLAPIPDAAYDIDLVYFGKIPALSELAPTNWLLEEAPDLFLYGMLLEASLFLGSDAQAERWGRMYTNAVGSLQKQDKAGRTSGSTIVSRASGATP